MLRLLLLVFSMQALMTVGGQDGSVGLRDRQSDLCQRLSTGSQGDVPSISSHTLGDSLLTLTFSRFTNPAGSALVVLHNGRMVAYGFGSSTGLDIPLPPEDSEGSGNTKIVLAVAMDTGRETLKEFSDLCFLDSVSIAVPWSSSATKRAGGEVGISFPHSGSRLLESQDYLLRFVLEREAQVSISVNGSDVRERQVYAAGEHSTSIDFLTTRGRSNISIVSWRQSDGENREEDSPVDTDSVVVALVDEPPSIMFQFPPPGYVFHDPENVNLAVLITYHAFLRHPLLDGGTIRIIIDWQVGAESRIARDGEGVFETHIKASGIFAEEGTHVVNVEVLDSTGRLIPYSKEVHFVVGPQQQVLSEQGDTGGFALEEWAQGEADVMCKDDTDCGSRGVCDRGLVCLCRDDYIGDRCEVSLMTDLEYLPETPPHLHPARALLAAWFHRGARELFKSLSSSHTREACTPDKAILFEYNDQGLAAQVSDASVQLTYALKLGRVAAFVGEWTYGTHKGCEPKGVGCHFVPHLTCGEAEGLELAQEALPIDPLHAVPDEHVDKGYFWWFTRISYYLMRPNDDFQLKVQSALAAVGFEHPIIGVHVRNGDYCTHESEQGGQCLMYRHCMCQGFDVYAEKIKQMRDLYGVKTVFLATQDERIVRAASAEEGIRVLSLSFDREQLTGSAARKALHWRLKLGYVDRVMVSESALLDLFILARCDYFIGSFHSQYSRLAYQLMANGKGHHPPFSSVNTAWGGGLTYPL